jgi:hypothetical protein
MKKYKSPDSDQILAELIQAGGEPLLSVIHKLISSIWNKKELPDQWKYCIIAPIPKNYGGSSTTAQIFCINQIVNKKWDYNETVHQLFIDLKKTYD